MLLNEVCHVDPGATAERGMPDVAGTVANGLRARLDWVGMENVHQAIRFRDGAQAGLADARVRVYVNLEDPAARGIHMSRLYLQLDRSLATESLSPAVLVVMLEDLCASHADLSSHAFLQFDFTRMLRRKALLSGYSGLHAYPVTIKATRTAGDPIVELGLQVAYSSTCPCSAALARQLIQKGFDRQFGARERIKHDEIRAWLGSEQGIVATPHSQRSLAHILVKIAPGGESFPITELLDRIEETLQTPVQTAVKREDEQEFARRNAANLMFCEDAARRLKLELDGEPGWLDYRIRVEHMESLHPHNVAAIVVKGRPGGYAPSP